MCSYTVEYTAPVHSMKTQYRYTVQEHSIKAKQAKQAQQAQQAKQAKQAKQYLYAVPVRSTCTQYLYAVSVRSISTQYKYTVSQSTLDQ